MTAEIKKVPIPRRGVDYRGKIVLAPMVRSGETASRLLALRYGADLVWGEHAAAACALSIFGKLTFKFLQARKLSIER
jgi:hypothetical protein